MRNSDEIIQEILYLARELVETQRCEKQEQQSRLYYLMREVENQKQKQKDIASILMRE